MHNKQVSPVDVSWLNQHCLCQNVALECLDQHLQRIDASASSLRSLFVKQVLYIQKADKAKMDAIILAIKTITAMPAYQAWCMARAPDICHAVYSGVGDYLSFDFHLSPSGPKLIEINTNPGAGYLSALLLDCVKKCVHTSLEEGAFSTPLEQTETVLFSMFKSIWRQSKGSTPLRTIAIVDTAPKQQFLYPEFLLFKQLFEAYGIAVFILDPSELEIDNHQLCYKKMPIDMVYNRLTDFYLQQAEHAVLRQSYLDASVVLTPSPQSYALYADKKNLIALTDPIFLESLGVSSSLIESLCLGIASTRMMHDLELDALWAMRREYYFKPSCGYGSKGVYRGAKLTRRVFQDILSHDYLMQTSVMPSKRTLLLAGAEMQDFSVDVRAFRELGPSTHPLKFDIARLYRGQTTNFTTLGGGFAAICYVE